MQSATLPTSVYGYERAKPIAAELQAFAAPPAPEDDRFIVVSPYTEKEHMLDLETLDVENQLLAHALSNMTCLRDDYATAPYLETFNWDEIIADVRAPARKRHGCLAKRLPSCSLPSRSRDPPRRIYADLGVL